jgi:hypothetical protein
MKSFVRVVIRRADGRFLVLREPGRPFWNFPVRELREETSIEAAVTSLELIAQGVYDVLGTPWEGFFFFAHEAMGECVPERADPPIEWSWVTSTEMVALAALPGLLTDVAEKVDASGMVTRGDSGGSASLSDKCQ